MKLKNKDNTVESEKVVLPKLVRLTRLPYPVTEPFYRYKMTNNSWQEFVDNYRTFSADIEQVWELLEDSDYLSSSSRGKGR